jgi:hypothetical protein
MDDDSMTRTTRRWRFEHRSQPLLPASAFVSRMIWSLVAGAGIIAVSLAAGMAGYWHFEGLSWIDAFLNAAMILSGMGPLAQPRNYGGKLFAGLYALYSGFVILLAAGIAFAPIVHRFLHRFHLEEDSQADSHADPGADSRNKAARPS